MKNLFRYFRFKRWLLYLNRTEDVISLLTCYCFNRLITIHIKKKMKYTIHNHKFVTTFDDYTYLIKKYVD